MICPECESESVVPIVYGKPGPELRELADRDEVKLGGCMVMADSPNRFCNEGVREFCAVVGCDGQFTSPVL